MKHSGGGWTIVHLVLYVLLCVSLWSSHFFISLVEPLQPSDLIISRVQITGGIGLVGLTGFLFWKYGQKK